MARGRGWSGKPEEVWAAQVQRVKEEGLLTSPPGPGVASQGRDWACFVGFEDGGGGGRGQGCHSSGNRAGWGWGG